MDHCQPAQPQSWEDLAQALIYDWARIPRPAIRKLIRSFSFTCIVVLEVARRDIYLMCDFQHVRLLAVCKI